MYRYKRLLVGLNFTDRDEAAIRYAAILSQMANADEIHFVHVTDPLDPPNDIRGRYPTPLKSTDEVTDHLKRTVNDHFEGHIHFEVMYEVVEGSPLAELLRQAQQKKIDLILVGRKIKRQGPRTLLQKLVRKAPCSVLIVPEGAEPKITKILVPVDLSENAADAVDVGVALASSTGMSDILCLNAFRVPCAYFRTGMTFKAFAETVRKGREHTFRFSS